ncbi:MAG: PH domain-containing protein [Candidatus Parvarchaeota archaeon]|nr:PH domain-containing protein [Candidatus Jingweiarchaeum tengchongense]MCW1297729.1 PH domain-containing protein [Candidatus Jingweiarchaeum tengchongense]MCW1299739.1 PH domain-containing protein [Candidatus Jingweiarchaeum tengchongense]MCW1304290.1 PH domain-containing protein [Candidatus Jingweiarchaeum tengchongense]MCW1305317.1 PH domain-containing protein [Candidatus Jingweiarchaeum tengchongense]
MRKGKIKIIGFTERLILLSCFFLLNFDIIINFIENLRPQFLINFAFFLIFSFLFISILAFFAWGEKEYYILKNFLHINSFGWKRIPLNEIVEVRVKQGLIEKMFGIGKIIISTKDGKYVIDDVVNPKEIEIMILRKISKGNEIKRYEMI